MKKRTYKGLYSPSAFQIGLLLMFSLLTTPVMAQLSDGSVAPNWTMTDLDGNTHTLYDYLDDGKTVFMDFSATWCSTCWNYHQTHALEDLYQMYGPAGTDEVVVFFVEAEANSNTNCIYDISGCNNSTQGDWTEGVSHPIFDNAGLNEDYEIDGFPTIISICSNRLVKEVGRADVEELYEAVEDCYGSVEVSSNSESDDESCFGASDGSIELNINGGPEPFTYQWSNGGTTADLNNLPQGTYTCTITNSTGTTAVSDPFVIGGPSSAVVASVVSIADASCTNNGGGSIDINVQGGNPSYEYDWSNGSTSQDISDLDGGTYSVVITDDDNCSTSLNNMVVDSPILPDVFINSPGVLSCNTTQLTLDVIVMNAGSNPSYQWSGPPILSGANTLTPTVDQPGTYTLTVTNGDNNCNSVQSVDITQDISFPAISIMNQNMPSCNGGNNGSVMVSVSGGESPYDYNWSNNGSGNSISGLTAGTYMLEVTGSNGCSETITVNLGQPNAINVSIVQQVDVKCNGDSDGSISLSGSGGTGNLSYNWSDGSSSASRGNLSAGSYIVSITDANNCLEVLPVTIGEPAALSTNVSSTGETALNANDGTATVSPSGGTMPYGYMWSSGATMATAMGLSSGTYTVTVTDANDCVSVDNAVVSNFDCTISADLNGQNVSCFNAGDGSIQVGIIGGMAPVTYQWSNGSSASTLSNLAAGVYSLTLTDANDCPVIQSINISEPTELTSFLVGQTNVICPDATDGMAELSATGGTSPYSYSWPDGNTNATRNDLGVGTYQVAVRDANQCLSNMMVTITSNDTENPILTCPQNVMAVNCDGLVQYALPTVTDNCGGGTITLTAGLGSGGTFPLGTTTETYGVMDASGNDASCSFTITVNNTLQFGLVSSYNVCFGDTDGMATVEAMGGTMGYSFAWSNGQTGATASNLAPGDYDVMVTDATGCTQSTSVMIAENPAITFTVDAVTNDMDNTGDGAINVTVGGGTGPYTYAWFLNGTEITNEEDIDDLMAGAYTCIITDGNDCRLVSEVLTVDNITNITNTDLESQIRLFPNPTSNHIHLSMTFNEAYEMQAMLYDLNGKQLIITPSSFGTSHQFEWELADYPQGVYFAKIRVGEAVITKRIVVK